MQILKMAFGVVVTLVGLIVAAKLLALILGLVGLVMKLLWLAVIVGVIFVIGWVIYKVVSPGRAEHA